jgi:sulfur carrier protein
MRVKINGEDYLTEKETITLIELLKVRGLKRLETVSVQLNGRLVKRKNFPTTIVKENDDVDYILMMSGGIFEKEK